MSKQRSTLLPTPATMSNEFCAEISSFRQSRILLRTSRTLLRHCCQKKATMSKQQTTMLPFALTLLLRHCCWCGPGFTLLLNTGRINEPCLRVVCLSTNVRSHPCLYSPAAEYHRNLACTYLLSHRGSEDELARMAKMTPVSTGPWTRV